MCLSVGVCLSKEGVQFDRVRETIFTNYLARITSHFSKEKQINQLMSSIVTAILDFRSKRELLRSQLTKPIELL